MRPISRLPKIGNKGGERDSKAGRGTRASSQQRRCHRRYDFRNSGPPRYNHHDFRASKGSGTQPAEQDRTIVSRSGKEGRGGKGRCASEL
jgi:hypothetical protein